MNLRTGECAKRLMDIVGAAVLLLLLLPVPDPDRPGDQDGTRLAGILPSDTARVGTVLPSTC